METNDSMIWLYFFGYVLLISGAIAFLYILKIIILKFRAGNSNSERIKKSKYFLFPVGILLCYWGYSIISRWFPFSLIPLIYIFGILGGIILFAGIMTGSIQIFGGLKDEKKIHTFLALIIGLSLSGLAFLTNYSEDYFVDRKDFIKLEKEKNIDDCKYYLSDHSKSKFYKDVFNLYDDLLYNESKNNLFKKDSSSVKYNYKALNKYLSECGDFNNYKIIGKHIDSIAKMQEFYHYREAIISGKLKTNFEFRKKYPKSIYSEEVNKVYDLAWDKVINNFQRQSHQKGVNELAVNSLCSVLNYLRSNDQDTIYIRYTKSILVKDIDKYPVGTIQKLKAYYNNYQRPQFFLPGNYTEEPGKSNIYSIENRMPTNYVENENLICLGMTNSFAKIFGNDFIEFCTNPDSVKNNSIQFSINYTVSNKLNSYNVPAILAYYERELGGSNFKGWVLDIKVAFKFSIIIPGNRSIYCPSDLNITHMRNSYDVINIENGYQILLNSIFSNYNKSILKHFGI
jgi:hypothetical protein